MVIPRVSQMLDVSTWIVMHPSLLAKPISSRVKELAGTFSWCALALVLLPLPVMFHLTAGSALTLLSLQSSSLMRKEPESDLPEPTSLSGLLAGFIASVAPGAPLLTKVLDICGYLYH